MTKRLLDGGTGVRLKSYQLLNYKVIYATAEEDGLMLFILRTSQSVCFVTAEE